MIQATSVSGRYALQILAAPSASIYGFKTFAAGKPFTIDSTDWSIGHK